MNNYFFRLAPGYCFYNGIAVFEQNGTEIVFLIENPDSEDLKKRIERAFKNHVEYVSKQVDCPDEYKNKISIEYKKCTRNELKKAISNIYRTSPYNLGVVAEPDKQYKSDKTGDGESEESAAVVLLDSMLNEARLKAVSDIHIEQNLVKFRIQGRLEKYMELPPKRCIEVVQRIKLLSGMNVIENRKSQDGRFIFNLDNPLYIRVSSVPVVSKNEDSSCESLVLRLLDPARLPLSFLELGFNRRQIERMELFQSCKDGLLIICGPTGSGKSTTAAALLKRINYTSAGQKKIISLEDPPEYVIGGVTQLRVDDSRDNSFENLLNHIFRQDPDVIMVGEIRDEKSAAAALRASLTGHLVIATLHTSSASGALLRLENLGLDRKLLASVIRGVIVQELELIGRDFVLMADVCFPCEGFSDLCSSEKGQRAIEELFDSESNGGEVLSKSLEVMKEKQIFENEENCENKDTEKVIKRKKRNLFAFTDAYNSDVKREA